MVGAPVFELHHLLLPGVQAPSLRADGENGIVLHTHVVQLGAVKLCLLCPQLQVDLLVTWKEEGPGRGGQSRSEASEVRALSPAGGGEVGQMEASSMPLDFIPHWTSCPVHS